MKPKKQEDKETLLRMFNFEKKKGDWEKEEKFEFSICICQEMIEDYALIDLAKSLKELMKANYQSLRQQIDEAEKDLDRRLIFKPNEFKPNETKKTTRRTD